MTFEQFQEKLLEVLQTKDEKLIFRIEQKEKNNGQIRTGVAISQAEINLIPIIYLEEFYEEYIEGKDLESIADAILQTYYSLPEIPFDIGQTSDFDWAKERIIMRLVNTEDNNTFLSGIPHTPFHDLSIVYYLLIDMTDNGTASMVISNELLHTWGVEKATIHSYALTNTRNLLSVDFLEMDKILQSVETIDNSQDEPDEDSSDQGSSIMYVLTNKCHQWGAVLMIYKDIMEKISDFFKEDYYILPSSTHEIILVPRSYVPHENLVNPMISGINRTVVDKTEWLSDHAYYYDKDRKEILSCA